MAGSGSSQAMPGYRSLENGRDILYDIITLGSRVQNPCAKPVGTRKAGSVGRKVMVLFFGRLQGPLEQMITLGMNFSWNGDSRNDQ